MHKLLRTCVVISLVFFNAIVVRAGEIKGHVYDRATREQSVGAYVVIKSLNKVSITGLDGSYHINNLEAGKYKVTISYMGYLTIDTTVTIKDNSDVVKLDVYQQSSSKELKEVQVSAKAEGGSDAFANNKEKNADNVMNILSARAIQISPDITVSEVMQRVSGVSMETSNSGSQYAVIRGMDKKYNTTLVNGVKIPSPDDKERYVPLDMFPAELLERLEVIKSLTPSMEADATGGTMNLVMKNAPDKLLVEGNVAIGYSTAFQNQDFQKYSTADVNWKSPAELLGSNVYAPVSMFPSSNLVTSNVQMPLNTNASLSLGDRFFKDKLRCILSGSYQNTYNEYNSDLLIENNTVSAPSKDRYTNNLPAFSDIEHREYSTLSKRLGVISKIDYKINDRNSISLFGTHIQLNEYRVRSAIDSVPGGSTFNNTWTNIIGVKYKTETRTTLQDIDNITLQGKHQLSDNISADWSLVGSEAKRLLPNDAQFSYATKLDIVTDPVTNAQTYSLGKPYYPYVTGQTDEWQHNTDKDLAAYVNLHYKVGFIPFLNLIDVGGLYRQKHRDNYDNVYSLDQVIDSTGYQKYTTVPNAMLQFTRTSDALGNSAANAGIYTFDENLTAYYAQAHVDVGQLKMLGGVRIENTQQSYVSSLPVTQPGKTASYNYTDILPSIQGKYDLNSKAGIRFSYFKSLYRPAFADLIPFYTATSDEYAPRVGNPFLKHSVIHNADVRYELFPKGLDQLMIGGFYKYIIDPIEDGIVPQSKTDAVLEPGNFGNATNYGIEIVVRKFFGNFGIAGNYTYTHSDINSDKVIYHKTNGSATDSAYAHLSQHRPLQGQAANIGNISLLYKNSKNKFEAQLAFVYTGERINKVSYYKDLDVWEKPTLNLDFSAQKQFGKHFIVYMKLKNLLNTGYGLFIKQPNTAYDAPAKLPYQDSRNYYTIESDYHYSTILIGLRYKLD